MTHPAFPRLLPAAATLTLLMGCVNNGPIAYAPATVGSAEAVMTAEPLMAMPVADAVAAPVTESRSMVAGGAAIPRSGVVTAGDIDDGLNLANFQRYAARMGRHLSLPQANFGTPVVAQLTGPQGQPAPGVRYTLRKPGAVEPFYDGYSGVDGRITVFPQALGAGRLAAVELRASPNPAGVEVVQTLTAGRMAQITLPVAAAWEPDFLDLVFVLDTTGSMGDELAWLTRELGGIVGQAQRAAPVGGYPLWSDPVPRSG